MILPLSGAHLDEVVALHRRSFPANGFFLSFLGPRFLRLYYEGIVGFPDAIGYVLVEEEKVVGLVCGTVGPSGFYRYLLRTRWWRFALAALGAALRKPAIVPRLVRAWRYPQETPISPECATLTSLAVDPDHMGRGIGAELVAAFLQGLLKHGGGRSVSLTTDRDGNDGVNAFYQAQGFRCTRSYITPEGRRMNEYTLQLGAAVQ